MDLNSSIQVIITFISRSNYKEFEIINSTFKNTTCKIFNSIAIYNTSDAETKAETYGATTVNSIVTARSTSGLSRFLHRILLVVHLFQ